MKKIAYVSGIFALLLSATLAPAANAQTYTYSNGSQICSSLTQYLAYGSSDSYTNGQVSALQRFLNTAGYLSGISGYFDSGTRSAVTNYQRTHGISQTGTVGPMTRASINQQSCGNNNTNYNYNSGYTNTGYNICYQNGYSYQCNCPVNSSTNSYYNGGYYYNNGYNNSYNSNCTNNGYNIVSLNSLSQTSGYAGQTITIYGNGFSNTNTVYFGGITLQNIYSSNGTSLTVTVPTGLSYGLYSISVSNGYSSSSNSLTFTVNNTWNNNGNTSNNGTWFGGGSQPSISSISGQSSVTTGVSSAYSVNVYTQNGLPFTVRADWGDGTSDQNGQSYQYSYSSSQQYSYQHTYTNSGTYTIRFTATDSNGGYAYSTMQVTASGNGYGYNNGNATPSISSLSQTYAQRGSTITIYGSNFASNAIVNFANTTVYTSTSYSNGNTLTFTIPNYSSGTYPVSVRNPNGSSSNAVNLTIW